MLAKLQYVGEKMAQYSVNTLGPCLIVFFYVLTGTFAYVFFETMVPILWTLSPVLCSIETMAGVVILLAIWKAHFKCFTTQPGYVSKYYVSSPLMLRTMRRKDLLHTLMITMLGLRTPLPINESDEILRFC